MGPGGNRIEIGDFPLLCVFATFRVGVSRMGHHKTRVHV